MGGVTESHMSQSNQENGMKHLFGSILKEVLSPSGIQVSVEEITLTIPPDADIIVCRRDDESLSDVVRDMLLADGLRDNTAPYVMIKFHDKGELNEDTVRETLAYSYVHYTKQALKRHDLHSFLVVTTKIKTDILKEFTFEQTGKRGVYHSSNPWLETTTVILLDELAVEPHNTMLKSLSNQEYTQQREEKTE